MIFITNVKKNLSTYLKNNDIDKYILFEIKKNQYLLFRFKMC